MTAVIFRSGAASSRRPSLRGGVYSTTRAKQAMPVGLWQAPNRKSTRGQTFQGSVGATVIQFPQQPDQRYYWTEAWQREEQRSLEQLMRGEFVDFESAEDAIAWLNEPE